MSNKIVKYSKHRQKPRGRKIAEADWDKHRDKILHLWLEDGDEGRTLDEIVEIMTRDHQFSATTAQYHNRILKKWSVRKNITKREWQKLYYESHVRAVEGRSTTFRFNNRLVSVDTKEREWGRYDFSLEHATSGLSPLPDAFEFEGDDALDGPVLHGHTADDATALVATLRPPAECSIFPASTVNLIGVQPFSWGFQIDWKILAQAVGADKQIVRSWEPDRSRLSAMLYPQHRTTDTVASVRGALPLQYLISSVVNGVGCAATPESIGVFVWLASLPRQQVLDILWSLPEEIVDVVCQRIRTAAADANLVDQVKSMLGLEHSLRKGRALDMDEMRSFVRKLGQIKELVIAEVFLRHAVLSVNNPDLVFEQLFASPCLRGASVRRQSIWLSLESGAMPTLRCFLEMRSNTSDLDRLLRFGPGDIMHWVKAGILMWFLPQYDFSQIASDFAWVLSQVRHWVYQRQAADKRTDDDVLTVQSSFSEVFQACINGSLVKSLNIVYESCCLLGFLPTYSESDWQINQEVLLACQHGDFVAATIAAKSKDTGEATVSPPQPSRAPTGVRSIQADLRAAILADDVSQVRKLCRTRYLRIDDEILDLAICEGSDEVGAFIASRPNWGVFAILKILSRGRLGAMDLVITTHSHLKDVLHDSRLKGDYTGLQDWLYYRQRHKGCCTFPCNFPEHGTNNLQLLLRVLSYCALHRRDTELLDWLRKQGLALSGLCVEFDDIQVLSVQSFLPSREKLLGNYQSIEFLHLPSLLEVSAGQGNLDMLQYFISATSAQRYSRALLQAVKANAYPVID